MSASGFNFIDSLILGIVQGITEFFPVSSDGHLAVAEILLGYHKESIVFDVLLHLGTLLALVFYFKKETFELFQRTLGLLKKFFASPSLKDLWNAPPDDRWILYVWLTTFVTGVCGILLEDWVEAHSSSLRVAGIGFLITACALFLSVIKTQGDRKPGQIGWIFPLIVGLAQSSALLTGISRSGMTIATAILLGVRREEAGRYSFVASIPIIAMAILYEARKLVHESFEQIAVMVFGVAVSLVVGLMALKGLMWMLKRMSLLPFAIYTLILGIICLVINA